MSALFWWAIAAWVVYCVLDGQEQRRQADRRERWEERQERQEQELREAHWILDHRPIDLGLRPPPGIDSRP
jgi:LmbE family N-acetylglucosaminyl deacetylase